MKVPMSLDSQAFGIPKKILNPSFRTGGSAEGQEKKKREVRKEVAWCDKTIVN